MPATAAQEADMPMTERAVQSNPTVLNLIVVESPQS